MDAQRFDTLVRTFAAGITRRGALGILAGLAGFQVADSAAAKRRRKRNGHKGAAKKKGRKKPNRAQAAAQDNKVTICHLTGSAQNPFVIITVAQSAVSAHEAHGDIIDPDFENDPENCGGCAVSCDDDNLCTTDTCVEGECVNTAVDCDDDDVCTEDTCDRASGCVHTDVTCPQGETCCPPDTGCTDLQTDPENCGACGNPCANGAACVAGSCECVPGGICQVDGDCCEGETCLGGICSLTICQGDVCPFQGNCDPTLDCQCYSRTEQDAGFCGDNTLCAGIPPCTSSADCNPGSFCAHDTCCGSQGVCITTCGTLTLGANAAASEADETTGGR